MELPLERVKLTPEGRAATHELPREPHPHGLLAAAKAGSERAQDALVAERALGRGELGVDVVQMPAQPLLGARRLADQVLAVIEQQLDGERRLIQEGRRQRLDPLSERGAGDGRGVDRVGLAALTSGAASASHQLRRDAHDAFAAIDEEALQAAGDVPAVLDRPNAP